MKQNDINFINILNRFWTTSQTFENINFINKICFKTPHMDNTYICFIQMLKQQHITIMYFIQHLVKHLNF